MGAFDLIASKPVRIDGVAATTVSRLDVGPGLELPPTYREWVRRFGCGEVADLIVLFVPLLDAEHPDDLRAWSRGKREFLLEGVREKYFEYAPDGTEELVARLVPFGLSTNGHVFAWDPAQATEGGEFVVYAIGSKMLAVRRAAASFADFVGGLFDERVKKILGPGYEPLRPVFRAAAPKPTRPRTEVSS